MCKKSDIKFYLLLITVIVLNNYKLDAQHNRVEGSKLFIQTTYEKTTGGEFYNNKGNAIHNITDSTSYPGYYRNYAFEISKHNFGLSGGYEVLKNLDIIGGFEVHYYSLQENFTTDTVSQRVKRAELKETRLDNFSIGADYYFLKTDDFLKVRLLGTIPSSQKKTDVKVQDRNDFLSSSPYEILTGIRGGMFTGKSYLEAEAYYNFRSGEFSDRLITGATIGLSTVENTMIRIQARYIYALEDFENPYFHIRQLTTHDTYLDLGFGFWGLFSDKYYFSFDYKIRPLGKNTWNSGIVRLVLGLNIDTN